MVVNRQKFYVSGAHLMAELARPELRWIAKNFPLLTSNLLVDQDTLVHSLGCSVWNTFGHEQGYMAVVECPAPGTFGADIRSDSGWFEPNATRPLCLIEFERFDGSRRGQLKLEEKLQNLLEAAQRWQYSPQQVVLSVWSQGVVSTPATQELRDICRSGFISSTGVHVSASPEMTVILSRFVFIKNSATIILDRIYDEVLV